MKSTVLKLAVTAAFLTGAAPAFANLVYQTGAQQTGQGLGAVNTVVTVQDNGGPQQNGTESGCATFDGGDPAKPATNCLNGLEGGDNTAGNAGTNTYFLSVLNTVAGLQSAGQLGFIVNVSEGGKTFEWRLEMDNRYELISEGMTAETLKAGDRVVANGSLSRTNPQAMYLMRLDRPADGFRYEQIGASPRVRHGRS